MNAVADTHSTDPGRSGSTHLPRPPKPSPVGTRGLERPIRPLLLTWIAAGMLVVCGGSAWGFHLVTRGSWQVFGYPAGFLIGVVFGFVGLWAAAGVCHGGMRPAWLGALRVAALFALFDALSPLAAMLPLGGLLALAAAHMVAYALLFREWRGWTAFFPAAIVFLVKVVSAIILNATVIDFFTTIPQR